MTSPIERLPFPGGIWLVDAEFQQPDGYPLPTGVWCIVAKEFRSGRTYRLWQDELVRMDAPPFPTGKDALFVCYAAPAELGAFEALGWAAPGNVYDCFTEYLLCANRTKLVGVPPPGRKLTDALRWFGLHHLLGQEKPALQALAIRGAPFSGEEREALLTYCETDVLALEELLPAILGCTARDHLDRDRYLGRALIRGDYMRAVGEIQRNGIPLDLALLNAVQERLGEIKRRLIQETDKEYGVFDDRGSFKQDLFEGYLRRKSIPWPRTPTGRLATDDDTWKDMAAAHPQLHPLKELTATLGKMKLNALAVGPDGRNRAYLNPFGSSTGRNQPGSSAYVFGPATWIRGFIRPDPGNVVLYLDWASQEIGIAAALSQDSNLVADYASGDFCTRFGTRTGFLPEGATKATHGRERERLKRVCLGLGYGLGATKMTVQMEADGWEVRKWIAGHKQRYCHFWAWLEDSVCSGFSRGWMRTRLGWQVRVMEDTRPMAVMNWMMQAHGAEMLRIAVILAARRGLKVIGTVHDALLLEAPADCWQDHARELQRCMVRASQLLLPGGFSIPVDGADKPVCYPNRYMDKRGAETWKLVMNILGAMGGRPSPALAG